jgi:glycosyltransferase involved in cell wall biosynthesis
MKKPRISVLIAVHNEEAYITEALNSLLEQSVSDFEAIIVDDGSTDATAEKIQPFLKDERFQLHQPGKIGKNNAFNLAFEQSKADWITFFCGDDFLPDESFEHKLYFSKKINPKTPAIGYSRVRLISTDSKFDGLELPKQKNRGSDSGSAMIFSRALADIIFPIPDILPNEDQWTSLCGTYFAEESFHIPHVCWHYRIHDNNSHRRDADFKTYSKLYHDRFIVYQIFLNKFEDKLKNEQIDRLKELAKLEEFRWNGSVKDILGLNLSFFEKIRAIIYSTSLLYNVRKRFYRLFSGW